MKKLIGIMGSGNIGREPFHPRAWSGSSKFFFKTCYKKGILKKAFGVEVPAYLRYPLMLKNFHSNKRVWREKFYHDPHYYNLLTKEIAKQICEEDFAYHFLQLGAIYDVPSVVRQRTKCYSYHDGDYINAVQSPLRKGLIKKSQQKQALRYASKVYEKLDKIFTMSDYLRNSIIDQYEVPPEKVKTIGGGINLDTLPELKDKNYQSQSILFIGIDFHRKGGNFILQAFSKIKQQVPHAQLHIIGPEKLHIPEKYTKGVHFHGFIARQTARGKQKFRELFDQASLFTLASQYEPFGIAPLEAMANQIPCLLPNEWAFPEMTMAGENGELFSLGDQQEFIDKAIMMLNKSPEELQEMGKKARETVKKKYTWDVVVDKLIEELNNE